MEETVAIMITSLENWLKKNNYIFYEINHVPEKLFKKNRYFNIFLRTFFRLFPYNLRPKGKLPLLPQNNIILLKAYSLKNDINLSNFFYKRLLSLKSTVTKHFSLSQGMKIAISIYEDNKDDPSPLNTAWFGNFLINENQGIIDEITKENLLSSIADYFVLELGYKDHKENGLFFYYGHNLKKEIYNASAVISSFLIKYGTKYNKKDYINLGIEGIRYILKKQNEDGSWFYSDDLKNTSIDNFHQSYILTSLLEIQDCIPFDIKANIEKGTEYYEKLLFDKKGNFKPIRYDKRFKPKNTWIIQKLDGRDLVEAIIFYSKYQRDEKKLEKIIEYTYKNFFNKKKGVMYPENLLYGKNHIPYIEFQAWFLYAFNIVKYENNNNLS